MKPLSVNLMCIMKRKLCSKLVVIGATEKESTEVNESVSDQYLLNGSYV